MNNEKLLFFTDILSSETAVHVETFLHEKSTKTVQNTTIMILWIENVLFWMNSLFAMIGVWWCTVKTFISINMMM